MEATTLHEEGWISVVRDSLCDGPPANLLVPRDPSQPPTRHQAEKHAGDDK